MNPSSRPALRRNAAPAPRGGRRARRAAETRERLFRCALALFAERGFANVTVEDITEAADVGKGTFFNYFPSKEHVLAAFGDLQLSKLAGLAADVREGHRSVTQVLRTLPRTMAEEPARAPRLLGSMVAAHCANDAVRKVFMEKLARGRAMLAEIIALGQKRGELRRGPGPATVARAVQQCFFGTLIMWAMDPAFSLEQRLDGTFELVWNGLVPSSVKHTR